MQFPPICPQRFSYWTAQVIMRLRHCLGGVPGSTPAVLIIVTWGKKQGSQHTPHQSGVLKATLRQFMKIKSTKSLLVTDRAAENISSEKLATLGRGEIQNVRDKNPYYKSLWKTTISISPHGAQKISSSNRVPGVEKVFKQYSVFKREISTWLVKVCMKMRAWIEDPQARTRGQGLAAGVESGRGKARWAMGKGAGQL